MKHLLVLLIPFAAILLLQATWFRQTKSITFDETYFLSCALQTVHDGKLDTRICSQGIAPLPILLDYLLPLRGQGENRPTPWEGRPQDARLIVGPRLMNSILVGLPLLLLVSGWLFLRQGTPAALAGAGLLVFSPSIVAHVSLATTDACFALFALAALAAIAWYFRQPSRGRFILLALAIAAAMAAKYSGVFLLPLAAAMFLLRDVNPPAEESQPSWKQRLKRRLRLELWRGFGLGAMILVFWWGLHLFSFTGPLKNVSLADTPDTSPWVEIFGRGPWVDQIMHAAHEHLWRPAPIDGVLFQYLHNRAGHTAFFMGRHSNFGWKAYFPTAFLMKSTPVELLLSAGLIVLFLTTLRAPWRALKKLEVDLQVLGAATLIFSVLVINAKINIGHRYILVLYPILIIAGLDRLWRHLSHRPKTAAWCGVILVAAQVVSCLSVAPNYLAYFNRFAGGPERGWHYLVDSNIDWGQDLPALHDELKRLGGGRVAMRYFGTANPQAYGVQADAIPRLKRPPQDYDLLAVSVSPLQGAYAQADDPFRELRELQPVGRAGFSILIYDLSDQEVQHAFQKALARYADKAADKSAGS